MSKKLAAILNKYVSENKHRLILARDRADDVRTGGLTLGESQRAVLLSATSLPTGDSIVNSAKVVAKLKRGALIKIADLMFYCNKWGVMTSLVPAAQEIGGMNLIHGPAVCSDWKEKIYSKLGVTSEHYGNSEYIHDYSGCEIPKGSL